jgi:hypothetical protein
MNRNKFKSNTAFQDMLFLMLSGVTVLWVLSFLLINPIAKINDIESPAEFIITMSWPDTSDDDIDMWLRTPDGKVIAFFNKDSSGSNLERDDLGMANECFRVLDRTNCIELNREVITLRGIHPGEYQLKFVVYNVTGSMDGNPVDMEIIKVNPYKIEFKKSFTYTKQKQSVSVIRFTVDAEGNISGFSDVPAIFSKPSKPVGEPEPNGRHTL